MAKKTRSPWVDELRRKDGISEENHQEMFRRLVRAGLQGIHNHPGPPKKKKGGSGK